MSEKPNPQSSQPADSKAAHDAASSKADPGSTQQPVDKPTSKGPDLGGD